MKSFLQKSSMAITTSLLCLGIIAVPFLAAAIEQVDYNQDYLAMKSVEEMYLTYNMRINDMFNDAFSKTLKGEGVIKVSEDEAEQNEFCTKRENIAAICLGIRALYEYRGYEEAMTRAKASPKIPLFKEQTEAKSLNEAHTQGGAKTNFVNRELTRSLDFQEATLDFYTEFMGAYQMHLSNTDLIEALAAYNEKLGEVRTETYQLAPQFHNVTTDGGGCT